MINIPSARDARDAMQSFLMAGRSVIEARVQKAVPSISSVTFKRFFTPNIDAFSFPLVMLEQTSDSREWHAMPVIAKCRFSMTIWMLAQGYEPEVLDDVLAELSAGVSVVLNQKHEDFEAKGFTWHFYEEMPSETTNYGAAQFTNSVVRSATTPVRVSCDVSMPQG